MYSLVWGKAQQLCFADDHEYYRALGSLCRTDSYTITFETNSETESWGDAFRIKCLRSDSQTPDAFIDAMRTARRINCNDYVQNLYEYHDFDVGNKVLIGNYEKVKKTVPSSYYYDFEEGYNLRFTRYDRKDRKKKQSVSHSEIRRTEMQKKNQSIVKNEQTVPKDTKAKPEPVPIKVNKGEMIIHKSFGRGKVVSADGKYLKVVFDGIGEKTFANPGAFEGGFIRKA